MFVEYCKVYNDLMNKPMSCSTSEMTLCTCKFLEMILCTCWASENEAIFW